MRIIKRITDKTITAIVIIALAIAAVIGALALAFPARAANEETKNTEEFAPTSLGISNANFSESGSTYPSDPTSWTGNGSGDGLVKGVVDLSANVYSNDEGGNKKFKLDQYDEYKTKTPQSIFGADSEYAGSDKKALLINTKPGVTASYTYQSSDMSFAPNAFYRVSVWVMTGDFAENTGATIKLSGLGENLSFLNVNTAKNLKVGGTPDFNKNNKYGWAQYFFYVRTSASVTSSVKLVLGLGDTDSYDDTTTVLPRAASGYAFFDTVLAEQISSYDYAHETSALVKSEDRDNLFVSNDGMGAPDPDTKVLALDLYEPEFMTYTDPDTDSEQEIGTFSQSTLTGWTDAVYNEDAEPDEQHYPGQAAIGIYNSEARINFDNNDNKRFTSDPWAPLGRAEYGTLGDNGPSFRGGSNGNILTIYAVSDRAARGVASPTFTIKRYSYYRFSVWVKGDGITSGNGISVAVKGDKNDTSVNNKLTKWVTGIEANSDDAAHYGWKEQVIYIVGSVINDLDVHFELWLGAPGPENGGTMSNGVAMFDNVTFTKLDYSDYSKMSAADSGEVVTLDASPAETGVTNGNFMFIGDYDEFKYPLPVASWNYYTASDVTVNGNFSKNEVDTTGVSHGLIPTDDATFDLVRSEVAGITNPQDFTADPLYSTLLISSRNKTAVCYQSPTITASASTAYQLTVDMAVNGVSDDGYGASLVLKTTDGNIVSTIEGIKDTNRLFKTYTFYIDAPLADKSLYLEIWLGLNDRKDNTQKLSDGNIYVKKVAMSSWTTSEDSDYNTKLEEFLAAASNKNRLKQLDFGVASFNSPSLDYFDVYSYNMDGAERELGTLYGWSGGSNSGVISGVFDSANRKNISLYNGFDAKDQSGNMLYVFNTIPTRSTYTYNNSITVGADTYHRLDVTLKVHVADDVRTNDTNVGVGLNLTGTVPTSFENIKDTTTLISQNNEESRDYETFKTYSFYISAGSNGGEIGLNITFGGTEQSEYIQGSYVVSNISMRTIGITEYENAKNNLDANYEKTVELSETTEEDNTDNTEAVKGEINWWLIPTIIFSVCLVAAIILILVMRLRDRAKKNKKVTYTSEYDRSAVGKKLDRLAEGNEQDQPKKDDAVEVDEFDEVTETPSDQSEGEQPATGSPADEKPSEPAEKPESLDD